MANDTTGPIDWSGIETTYSLQLNDAQTMFRDSTRRFAKEVLRPNGPEWRKREDHPPWEIIEEAANRGFYSWEDFQTMFADPTGLTFALVNQEMAYGDAGLTLAIIVTTLGVSALFGGTPEQLQEWAPQCFRAPNGDLQLAALCTTEPNAGSDLSNKVVTARKDGDDWILNGELVFISNGGLPRTIHFVSAVIDPELPGPRGQAIFIVPPETPGLESGHEWKKAGIQASYTGTVILSDVRVPATYLVGGEEKMRERFDKARQNVSTRSHPTMAVFEASRPILAAQAVGIAEAAFDYAVHYASNREVFGDRVIEKQLIVRRLFEMRRKIDAATALTHRALWLSRNGGLRYAEGSMAKQVAGQTAIEVTQHAIQILGGHGYVLDHPVMGWHNDSMIYTLFEGTTEIMTLDVGSQIAGVRIR